MAKSIEIFAGGGGMALGMLNAGFTHEQLVEIYPAACNTLRRNADHNPALWKRASVLEADIRDWLRDPDTKAFEGVDLIAGGPPCQPFSYAAGNNASHASQRNMFPAAADCIALLQPKTFVFENVPGLLRPSFVNYYTYIIDRLSKPSISPKSEEDWSAHHARIKRSRRPVEYEVGILTLEAADLGVPQTRKRVFILGVRADIAGHAKFVDVQLPYSMDSLLYSQWVTGEYWDERKLPRPETPKRFAARVRQLSQLEAPPAGKPWRTTRDAIAEFPPPVNGMETDGILNHKGIPGARAYKGHTGSWIDWPAKTLKAGVHGVCGGEAMIRFSDDSLRYLTVREAAKLQGFPNSYHFPDSRSVAMRLIGNAVAVDVAETVGRAAYSIVNRRMPERQAADAGTRFARIEWAPEIRLRAAKKRSTSPLPSQGGLW